MNTFEAVEVCAGAGGQALGLDKAGFDHVLAVELDEYACATLRSNRADWKVAQGDVADNNVWRPADYQEVSLLAGGVPCPPFTIAGKQLGASDERDLFAWAVEQVKVVRPRALLLENVRGLSMPRFAGYRQHVIDRLATFGYVAEWRLLHASDFGVPQLRPRFILVALKPEDAPYFNWPVSPGQPPTVGESISDLMGADGWCHTQSWVAKADKIAPTIVGGSKKHGGADLGPTRAKRAWAEMGVDALGIADAPPRRGDRFDVGPKLTADMVARLQGWSDEDLWEFSGRKTARYRQIGNAFAPPVAHAVGGAIVRAFEHQGESRSVESPEHDPIYAALKAANSYLTSDQLQRAAGVQVDQAELERRIGLLSHDFDIEVEASASKTAFKLGKFKAFVGQQDHDRHGKFFRNRAKIS